MTQFHRMAETRQLLRHVVEWVSLNDECFPSSRKEYSLKELLLSVSVQVFPNHGKTVKTFKAFKAFKAFCGGLAFRVKTVNSFLVYPRISLSFRIGLEYPP